MPKFLHIADLHLDSRFTGLAFADAAKRRAELRTVFKNTLAFAKKEGCCLTLISGDVFDGEYYTPSTLAFLSECFSSMPDHKFVISPGNHDPLGASSPYRFADFPKNVFIFDTEALTSIDFDDIGVTVYGYAFTSDYYGRNPLDGFSIAPTSENFNILCAPTELDNHRSPYAPISTSELADSGLDYAALGHIHKSDGIKKAGNTVYAYSGCLAGRDFSEDGEKGGIIVSLDYVGKAKKVTAAPVRFCPWVYTDAELSVTELTSTDKIVSAAKEKLSQMQGSSLEYIIRITLRGQTSVHIDESTLISALSAYGVHEIKNETFFVPAGFCLEEDYSLRGEFYRTLKPLLDSPDPQKRNQAELALSYGLCALDRGEIEI